VAMAKVKKVNFPVTLLAFIQTLFNPVTKKYFEKMISIQIIQKRIKNTHKEVP